MNHTVLTVVSKAARIVSCTKSYSFWLRTWNLAIIRWFWSAIEMLLLRMSNAALLIDLVLSVATKRYSCVSGLTKITSASTVFPVNVHPVTTVSTNYYTRSSYYCMIISVFVPASPYSCRNLWEHSLYDFRAKLLLCSKSPVVSLVEAATGVVAMQMTWRLLVMTSVSLILTGDCYFVVNYVENVFILFC